MIKEVLCYGLQAFIVLCAIGIGMVLLWILIGFTVKAYYKIVDFIIKIRKK